MAWYALYKWFVPWRKIKYTNRIMWYRNYLYNEWFNSLSDERKQIVIKRIEARKREHEQRFNAFNGLLWSMDQYTGGKISEHMKVIHDINKLTIHPSKYW